MPITHRHAPVRQLAFAAALAALFAGTLSACGDDDIVTGDGPMAHPQGAALVLEVRRTGGLRAPGADFSHVPVATVLGDGTMIVEGAQIDIFPPPILPPLFEMRLSADGMQELLAAAGEAGLLSPPPDYGQPPIADATTTVITVHAGGDEFTHEVYALLEAPPLDPGDGLPGLTTQQRALRAQVADFVGMVTSPEQGLVPSAEVTEATPFEAQRFAITASPVQPGDDEPDPEVEPEVLDWPLPDITLADAAGCLEVDGAEAERLSEVLADANTLTRFRQDDVVYEFAVRPLLAPDDGCDATSGG